MVLWWASLSLISEFGGFALVIVGFGSFASQDRLVVFGLAWLCVCCGGDGGGFVGSWYIIKGCFGLW